LVQFSSTVTCYDSLQTMLYGFFIVSVYLWNLESEIIPHRQFFLKIRYEQQGIKRYAMQDL